MQEDPKKDNHQRPSISTYTGVEFFPLDPREHDIYMVDIAHALSMKCRFTGHCRQFYSVAQHSVFVARILQAWGASDAVQFAGLMHDASEAYLPDVASPIKPLIPGFKEAEGRVQEAISKVFGIEYPLHSLVHSADVEAFRFEDQELMPHGHWREKIAPERDWGFIPEWSHFTAEKNFLTLCWKYLPLRRESA